MFICAVFLGHTVGKGGVFVDPKKVPVYDTIQTQAGLACNIDSTLGNAVSCVPVKHAALV